MQTIALAAACVLVMCAAGYGLDGRQAAPSGGAPKILIATFSKTGNTGTAAELIHSRIGGDMFRIVPAKPYPDDCRETTRVAQIEKDNNERPELAATVPADVMKGYDVVFLGFPIWWGTMPMAVATFLERHDLAGKTIVPFCTHGGGGAGSARDDVAKIRPDASIGDILVVRGGSAAAADVDAWLLRLGFAP